MLREDYRVIIMQFTRIFNETLLAKPLASNHPLPQDTSHKDPPRGRTNQTRRIKDTYGDHGDRHWGPYRDHFDNAHVTHLCRVDFWGVGLAPLPRWYGIICTHGRGSGASGPATYLSRNLGPPCFCHNTFYVCSMASRSC